MVPPDVLLSPPPGVGLLPPRTKQTQQVPAAPEAPPII